MEKVNDTLFIIPARGGSKGLPRKNILPLLGKPLILYTIDAALGITDKTNICVSTDDTEIINIVESYGISVPFIRPKELASDTSGSWDVIKHAIDYYQNVLHRKYSRICLLQPTSPLRTSSHIKEAFKLWQDDIDLIVSVKESEVNPYYNLFDETEDGYLKKAFDSDFTRRQDAPKVWEFNGAIYLTKTETLKLTDFANMKKKVKFLMSKETSVDIDNILDFKLVEILLKERNERNI